MTHNSDASCNSPCPGDKTTTCGGYNPTSKTYYASYYNITTLPPPRETIASAVKVRPAATCTPAPNIAFTGKPIEIIYDFANADACCEICLLSKHCTAWTASPPSPTAETTNTCTLFSSTVGQVAISAETNVSGYSNGALTHFRNPRSSDCLSDEKAYAIQELGFAATWCSSECSTDADCPVDVPFGSTAKPRCLIQEPWGSMKRCVLVCTQPSDCGNGRDALCSVAGDVSICTYINGETPQKITEPRFVGSFNDFRLPGGTFGNTANRDLPITFCSNGTDVTGVCLADTRVPGTGRQSGNVGGTAELSPRLCARLCDGYKYAGIQDGYECFCGNSYGNQGVANISGTCQANQPENSNVFLACGAGETIASVVFASFGTPTGDCSNISGFTRSTCDAQTTVAIVTKLCVGKPSCAIAATTAVFGEPCEGVFKHFSVDVTCSGPPAMPTTLIPCHGDPSLNCGAPSINDIYALTTEVQAEQCATVAENTNLEISCEQGSGMVFTHVTSATFGNLTNFATMCSATRAPLACQAPTATVVAYVAKQCVGKNTCTLAATRATFAWNTLCATPIYLTASLSCAPDPQCK